MERKLKLAKLAIHSRKGNAAAAIKYFREEGPLPEIVNLMSHLLTEDSFYTKSVIGITFPESWSDVFSHAPLMRSKNVQRSVNWQIALFITVDEKIKKHISFREKIELSAYRGEWQKAQQLLDEHTKELGKSLWELKWRLLIADEIGSESERRKMVESITSTSDGTAIKEFAGLIALSLDKSIPSSVLRETIKGIMNAGAKDHNQFFFAIILDDYSELENISMGLNLAEYLPIIDRYNFLIKTSALAIAKELKESKIFIRAVSKLLEFIPDSPLQMIKDISNLSGVAPTNCIRDEVFKCWDAYFKNEYANAISQIDKIQTELAIDFNLVELRVKSRIYLDQETACASRIPKEQLEALVFQVHKRGADITDALSKIDQFSLRFPFIHLSVQTRAFYLSQNNPDDIRAKDVYGMIFARSHTPRLLERFAADEGYLDYLKTLEKVTGSEAVKILRQTSDVSSFSEKEWDGVIEFRKLFFTGIYFFRLGETQGSINCFEEFLDLQRKATKREVAPFAIEEVKRFLISAYDKTNNVLAAQKLLVDAYQHCAQSIRRMPIDRIYQNCKQNVAQASKVIHYPILASLVCNDPHEVCLALKHFLRHLNVKNPSQLSELIGLDADSRANLPLLFLKVCTLEALDSLVCLETQEKVEEERLAVLRWVAANSPELSRSAENEMLKLVQETQLRNTLDLVDETRVVLNISALREAEEERLAAIYSKFKSQHELNITQFHDNFSSKIKEVARGTEREKILIFDISGVESRTEQAYRAAFKEIREIFLTSPHYGLEACLSGRVRHGILVEHIVRPLRSKNLLISKDLLYRDQILEHWKVACSGFMTKPDAETRHVESILEQMSSRFLEAAKEVKDVWIQSRTEERNSGGLFDYTFTDEELRSFLKDSMKNLEPIEFLDQIFLVLSMRTRSSLSVIRSNIIEILSPRLKAILSETVAQIQALGQFPGIRNELVSAIQDSEKSCEEMIRWFSTASGVLMDDVDVNLVCRTAVGMVERLHTHVGGRTKINVETSIRIKGRHVTSLVHVLFFLLENGVKHTTSAASEYAAKVSVSLSDKNLEIQVSTSMKTEKEAESALSLIREKIKDVSNSLELKRILKEGGSGFAKILATFRYGFRQAAPKIEVETEGVCVVIKILGKTDGIAA